MLDILEHWKYKLGLHDWEITIQRINPEQVTYPDDCQGKERFFVGITADEEELHATIFHDRPLKEEDIVHELLHVAYPSESEDWVNDKTNQLINK